MTRLISIVVGIGAWGLGLELTAVTVVLARGSSATSRQSTTVSAVIEARISPDGSGVAYVRERAGSESHDLLRVAFAGGEPIPVAMADGRISQLRWSPDGERLAYISREVGDRPARLRQVASQGGPPRTLSRPDRDVTAIEFSSDGRHLRFSSGPAGSSQQTIVEAIPNAGRAGAFPPTVDVSDRPAAAPPTGVPATVLFVTMVGQTRQAMVLAGNIGTWIDLVDLASGIRTTVMRPGVARIVAAPSWSADAGRFAVAAALPGEPAEVFAGSLPTAAADRPDWVGAGPPRVRQITFPAR